MATINEFPSLPESFFVLSEKQKIVLGCHSVSDTMACIMTTTICIAILRQTQTPSSLFIIVMCTGDLLLMVSQIVFVTSSLSQGRFAGGPMGCLMNGLINLFACYLSVLSILNIAIERFMAVVAERPITKQQAWYMILVTFLISAVVSIVPAAVKERYSLFAMQSSKEACSSAWWSSDPINVWINLTSIILLTLCIMLVTGCYLQILIKYFTLRVRVQNTVDSSQPRERSFPSKANVPKEILQKERRLLVKCIAITAMLICGWTPYYCKILFELITRQPVSEDWDGFATTIIAVNAFLNPIILFFYDNQVRSQVNGLLGIKIKPKEPKVEQAVSWFSPASEIGKEVSTDATPSQVSMVH
ncbi:hypothetical protein EDD86DRAFT_266217 [Gorgonomyces haynaldii]|nr:hypothetical protein EDD86DRAFT_266217 [Gorgonomyces haynaldii]